MALVTLQTASATVERRSSNDGSFAAEVPAGAVTVTAYPPEDKRDLHSTSAPVEVTGVAGQVTLLNGTTTGAVATIQWTDYWPLNVGDKKYGLKGGHSTPHGDWERNEWEIVCGTTIIGGQTGYIELVPNGPSPPCVNTAQDIMVSETGNIVGRDASGALVYYGGIDLIRRADDTLEFVACLLDEPAVVPPLRLGQEFTATSTVHQETINVTLMAGVTLDDLVDPGGWTGDVDECPTTHTLTIMLSGSGEAVTTGAGTFTDTVTYAVVDEKTVGDVIEAETSLGLLARDVGDVAYVGYRTERGVGDPLWAGDLVESWHSGLLYAHVGGVDWGTAP